jgi:Ca2+:H+ antiporter
MEPLYWLLLAFPLAIALRWAHVADVWIFLASAVAIIPLAGLMGRATENLAETLGAGIGGLLNATFGNAAELIIALAALWKARVIAFDTAAISDPDERVRRADQLLELVKASITGSIIGNILLVLGLAILAGGLFHKRQVFNRTAASMGTTLLALASVGLLVPSLYYYLFLVTAHTAGDREAELRRVEFLSEEIAVVLAGLYVLSLIFSLKTHQHLFAGPEEELPTTGEPHHPEWGRRTSLIVLLLATVGVAVMSELLVGSVEHAAEMMGMNEVFVGVIVVAIIGNAAEHSTAVLVAIKDKMDLSVTIAVGSSIQIALFVAPVLVFASMLMGHPHPLDLHFTPMELMAVVACMGVLSLVSNDGETHWMEGAMLLAVYVIFALAFYHLPEGGPARSIPHQDLAPRHPRQRLEPTADDRVGQLAHIAEIAIGRPFAS